MMGRGYDKLWGWFSLSYASWLTLPRVLIHEMPDDWQGRMADLLEEYEEVFQNQPDLGTRVQCTNRGKLVKTPQWLIQYRYPDKVQIDTIRTNPRERIG